MAVAATLASAATPNEEEERLTTASSFDEPLSSDDGSPSARGIMSRLHAGQYNPGAPMTCDKHPRICRAPGSPGPDCCRKKCVNVDWDRLNCGRCGKCCRYGQTCCRGRCVNVMNDPKNCGHCGKCCSYGHTCCSGRCVNVMNDPKNCGACNNKCKKGGVCKYGMCDYA
ncbi:protein STIG1-like [Phoenix dactylifera]|uniref:Protein STIG1-like n=1 Tax=Phoenix dactylifera TaxID=42345 RepID=A0A8B9AJK3_PHODC|nr:protein STIG1-like [Phoenix dactylifera]